MKCKRQPAFLIRRGIKISNVWEVRISPEMWERIVKMANFNKLTYSWIIRYCSFRLASKKSLRMRPAMENLSYQIKSELPPSKDCHRHMLCLYGDDEKFLRLRAMELGVSVSQFIRIAIALYIRHFEFNERIYRFWSNKFLIAQFYKIYGQDEIPFEQRQNSLKKMVKEQTGTVHKRILSPAKVFWYGIKFCKSVSCDFVKNSSLPLQHIFTFTRYAETDWFRIYYPPPSDYPFEGFSIAA